MNGFASALEMVTAKVAEWHAGFFYILPNLIVAFLVALLFLALAFALSSIIRKTLLRAIAVTFRRWPAVSFSG